MTTQELDEVNASHPLAIVLSALVPMKIMELQARGGPDEWDFERAQSCADLVAEKMDGVLYRGNKHGDAGASVAAIVFSLAVMAFNPGGVKLFGTHYCSEVEDA